MLGFILQHHGSHIAKKNVSSFSGLAAALDLPNQRLAHLRGAQAQWSTASPWGCREGQGLPKVSKNRWKTGGKLWDNFWKMCCLLFFFITILRQHRY
jgi:hypothetical protein